MSETDIISLFMVFTEDAMRLAEGYTKHMNNTLVTEQNILKSLKLRAVNGVSFWNREGIEQKINHFNEMIETLINESEDETEDEDESELEDETEGETEECPNIGCSLCKSFNEIDDIFKDWKPVSDFDNFIVSSILGAEEKIS
jgi:hypothetical protein